jgi:hypothetical protein
MRVSIWREHLEAEFDRRQPSSDAQVLVNPATGKPMTRPCSSNALAQFRNEWGVVPFQCTSAYARLATRRSNGRTSASVPRHVLRGHAYAGINPYSVATLVGITVDILDSGEGLEAMPRPNTDSRERKERIQ